MRVRSAVNLRLGVRRRGRSGGTELRWCTAATPAASGLVTVAILRRTIPTGPTIRTVSSTTVAVLPTTAVAITAALGIAPTVCITVALLPITAAAIAIFPVGYGDRARRRRTIGHASRRSTRGAAGGGNVNVVMTTGSRRRTCGGDVQSRGMLLAHALQHAVEAVIHVIRNGRFAILHAGSGTTSTDARHDGDRPSAASGTSSRHGCTAG